MIPVDGCKACGKEIKRKYLTDWRCSSGHMNIQTHPSYDKAIEKLATLHLKTFRENWIKNLAEREK